MRRAAVLLVAAAAAVAVLSAVATAIAPKPKLLSRNVNPLPLNNEFTPQDWDKVDESLVTTPGVGSGESKGDAAKAGSPTLGEEVTSATEIPGTLLVAVHSMVCLQAGDMMRYGSERILAQMGVALKGTWVEKCKEVTDALEQLRYETAELRKAFNEPEPTMEATREAIVGGEGSKQFLDDVKVAEKAAKEYQQLMGNKGDHDGGEKIHQASHEMSVGAGLEGLLPDVPTIDVVNVAEREPRRVPNDNNNDKDGDGPAGSSPMDEKEENLRLMLNDDVEHEKETNSAFLETSARAPVYLMKLWPSTVIPYAFKTLPAKADPGERHAMQMWLRGMTIVAARTNVVPTPVLIDSPLHKILIDTTSPYCSSQIGFGSGRVWNGQNLNFSPNCGMKGAQHELMHALGFHHVQTRKDRDNYVTFEKDNMLEGKDINFEISEGEPDGPFDYASILMYGPLYFSKDGTSPVLVANDKWKDANAPPPINNPSDMGMASGLSQNDVELINKRYGNSKSGGSVGGAGAFGAEMTGGGAVDGGSLKGLCTVTSASACSGEGWTDHGLVAGLLLDDMSLDATGLTREAKSDAVWSYAAARLCCAASDEARLGPGDFTFGQENCKEGFEGRGPVPFVATSSKSAKTGKFIAVPSGVTTWVMPVACQLTENGAKKLANSGAARGGCLFAEWGGSGAAQNVKEFSKNEKKEDNGQICPVGTVAGATVMMPYRTSKIADSPFKPGNGQGVVGGAFAFDEALLCC